jgi:hypothetical protein
MERLMLRPIPAWSLFLVGWLALVAVVAFGATVLRPPSQPLLRRAVLGLANVPELIGRAVHRANSVPRPYADGRLPKQPQGLWRNAAQPFTDPGYVLLTAFDEALKRPVVRLIRLSDGAVIHQYAPDIDAANRRSTFTSALIDVRRDRDVTRNLMMHPLLMPDGGLVVHDSSPLARFDACGRLEWMIDGIFHHSVERDAAGNIWASFRYPNARLPGAGPLFDDEGFMQVSPQGRPLFVARIADVLDANGLGGLWRSRPYTDDPFHLNDVQPVLTSGPYWQKGDLFLSLRNLSTILLYRPSTGKVLWWRTGPWAMQHDVSVIDDHRISVFDNHWRVAWPEGEVDGTNRVAVYDFATQTTSFPMDRVMTAFGIDTHAQGRATPLPNGDFMIEETEHGRVLRAAPDGTVRWLYTSATPSRRRLQLRWSRYVGPDEDIQAINQARGAKCN